MKADLRSLRSSFIIPMVWVRNPRLATMQALDDQLILRTKLRKLRFQVLDHEGIDELGSLVRYKADGEFA